MKFALSTQPDTKKELLKRSLKLYRTVFLHLFFLSLLLAITGFIPRLLMAAIGEDVFSMLPPLSPYRLWLVLINLAVLIFYAAILWRIRCVITDTHESLGDDMKIALKKIPYIFVAVIIQNFLFIGILILFGSVIGSMISSNPTGFFSDSISQVIVSIILFLQTFVTLYLFFAFYFYFPIIVIENRGIIDSLRKSAWLVWGNWWRTFIVQMTPWVVYLLTLMIIKYITRVDIHLFLIESGQQPTLLAIALQILTFAIFIPWIGSVMLLQLHDLELRKKVIKEKLNLKKPS